MSKIGIYTLLLGGCLVASADRADAQKAPVGKALRAEIVQLSKNYQELRGYRGHYSAREMRIAAAEKFPVGVKFKKPLTLGTVLSKRNLSAQQTIDRLEQGKAVKATSIEPGVRQQPATVNVHLWLGLRKVESYTATTPDQLKSWLETQSLEPDYLHRK